MCRKILILRIKYLNDLSGSYIEPAGYPDKDAEEETAVRVGTTQLSRTLYEKNIEKKGTG